MPATTTKSTSDALSPPTMATKSSKPQSRSSVSGAGDTSRPRSPAVGVARPRSDSARASLGPGDGHASDASKSVKPKKPKKRGWKGWAMQDLDEFGNVIEERLRNETPPRELTAEEKAIADAAFAAVVDSEEMERQRSGQGDVPVSREPSASRTTHSDPIGSKAGTGTGVSPPPASAHLDTSTGPQPILNLPASTNAVPENTELFPKRSRAVDKDDKEKAPKKRRKNSTSMTPQPNDSRATSSDPRPAPANGKGKARASLPSALSLTARQQGLEAKNAAAVLAREAKEKDAASARASPYVVDNDAPLPKVPRKGMGDDQPPPSESDIRGEAAFILEAAEKHRQERLRKEAEAARNSRSDRPASPPLTGGEEDIPPLRVALPNGNGDHSTSYQTPAHTGAGFDTGGQSSQPGPSQSKPSPRGRPEITTDEEFAAQFEAMKDHYSEQENHIMPVFSDDPRPPKFHQGQKPTVVLAAQQGRQPGRIRDKHERAYLEGFDGLPEEFEREIAGFVDNVRKNMKHVVDFYFDHPTLRRDAFIEKIGRELSILGAQLTSDGEAALLPPRQEH